MNIPSVMTIEMAIQSLKSLPTDIRIRQIKELNMLGPERTQALGVHLGEGFESGYELGLQTMRMVILLMTPSGDPRKL